MFVCVITLALSIPVCLRIMCQLSVIVALVVVVDSLHWEHTNIINILAISWLPCVHASLHNRASIYISFMCVLL